MRLAKRIGGCALTAALALGIGTLPARADGGTGLPWQSPNKITSGVAVQVASIAPCPAVPTPGDTVLVQITLSFETGGSAQILAANPDGSWSGTVTFVFPGVGVRHTTISAECLDFNGVTATPYAQYMVRHTQILN